jgi:NAD(P)H-dependent FMN reductase
MITIIQATNRPDSNSEFVSKQIAFLLSRLGMEDIRTISMANLPDEILHSTSYEADSLPPELMDLQDQLMIPASKFIWILPEYNGSFPGVLKFFIDVLSVRKLDDTFSNKKSMLIGIATGRSGNIRGLDHFTSILIHLKSIVFPRLLPISRVSDLMDESGCIIHEPTLRVLEDHLKGFVSF